MVGSKKIALNPAIELSYLTAGKQAALPFQKRNTL